MRALFGMVSLLLVLAIVGVLVKKQLSPAPLAPATADGSIVLPVPTEGSTVRQQSQQIQQQYRQKLEGAMQQARPMPDDK